MTLVRRHRLPDIGIFPEAVEMGSLISYGVDMHDLYRRSAGYIDKILKGVKPADLPIQQPTKYDLVINLKTAKELGLKVPQSLHIQATRFIE